MAGKVVNFGGKLGSGSGVTANWVRRGKLGHHKKPRGSPGRTDGGDEELGWEGFGP